LVLFFLIIALAEVARQVKSKELTKGIRVGQKQIFVSMM